MAQDGIATLLYGSECPVGYQCLAADCIECLKLHMEMEEETDGI